MGGKALITEIAHIIQEKKYSALLKCAESVLPKKMIENVSFLSMKEDSSIFLIRRHSMKYCTY